MSAPPGLDLSGVRAALFDLDGTLVDSEPVHREVWWAFFESRGWHVSDEEYHANFVGRRGVDVFRSLDGPWRDEDPHALLDEVMSFFPEARERARSEPMAGAAALVRRMSAEGVPVAVVTSATREWVDEALRQVDVAHLVTAVVSAEDVTAGKPDPEGYLRACDVLGVRPEQAVAFEDSPSGVQAATGAGVGLVVGVLSTSTAPRLWDAGAHRVVETLEEQALREAAERKQDG